jgi:hypothetical protein
MRTLKIGTQRDIHVVPAPMNVAHELVEYRLLSPPGDGMLVQVPSPFIARILPVRQGGPGAHWRCGHRVGHVGSLNGVGMMDTKGNDGFLVVSLREDEGIVLTHKEVEWGRIIVKRVRGMRVMLASRFPRELQIARIRLEGGGARSKPAPCRTVCPEPS